ncbi:MAG: hypothetical protein GY926_18540, partial [bacterium]|nr:hypothetical protein [bacterium]
VVIAQYSAAPEEPQRTIVFSRLGWYLRTAANVWLTPNCHAELTSRLGAISQMTLGSCDAMYFTPARRVWAAIGDELHLWHWKILVARLSPREAAIRKQAMLGWSAYPVASFSSCHAYVSPTWARRGVALERMLGRRLVVAEATEPSALMDPTYDGIDLMCDASWVGDLAQAVSAVTCLPLEMDDGL